MPSPTSTKEIATSTMSQLKRLISGSSRDEDGEPKRYILSIERKNTPSTNSTTLDDDVARGFAVVRTIAELRALDVELRHYVTSSDGFPTFVTPTQNFLQKVIETNQAVNSPALAKFLSIAGDPKEVEDYTEPTLEYVKYLLPNIQTPTYEALPRFGSLQRKVDTFLPGWWLVWYLEVDDAPVDFTIFATGADGELEQVHHEVVSQETSPTTDSSCDDDDKSSTDASSVSGSYRIMSEPTRAMIQLKAQSMLHEQRVFLEYAAIPHDAFTAACAAANEANAVAHLRQTAPMLSRILKHSEPVTIVVQEYKEDEYKNKEQVLVEKFDESANELDDSTCLSVAQLATLSDQVVSLEQSNATLQEECDALRDELQQSQASVDELTETVQQADSERRVWTVVRQELNAELSRLTTGLQKARLYQEASVSEMHDLRQELQESKGQVKLMELLGNDDPTGGNSSGQVEELVQVIRRLERDLQSEKDKSGELQKSIHEVEKSAEARVAKAQEEAHQAKVEQRTLESQVRQIKGNSSRAKPPRMPKKRVFGLDPALVNFKHPDARLDEQLSTLRDRHAQLCTLMNQNPNGNAKNADIVAMLEKAIRDLVARGSKA